MRKETRGEMVPHLWHSHLRDGLAVQMLVWYQHGETPDAILWQARNEVTDALCVADEPHMAYLRAEYREGDPLKLSRKLVLAALAQLMTVAQCVTMTMDRLSVEHTQVLPPGTVPHLADLFAQIADPLSEEEQRRYALANHLTIAWPCPPPDSGQIADLPTIAVNRITGDDTRLPPPPPSPESGWGI